MRLLVLLIIFFGQSNGQNIDFDFKTILLFCESFKGQYIYDELELGTPAGCESNFFPRDKQTLCLVQPTNIQQALDHTCKDAQYFNQR